MEWIKKPEDSTSKNLQESASTDGFCLVRVCTSKSYCDGYFCVALHCTTNY